MYLVPILTLAASLAVPSPPYGFIADTDRFVTIGKTFDGSHYCLIGRFDAAGHFNERSRIELHPPLYSVHGSGPLGARVTDGSWGKPESVYEFRYGKLVPGTIRWGHFTPGPNGKSIRFENYRYYGYGTREIWNLPGYFRLVTPLGQSREPAAALAGATVIVGEPISKTDRERRIQQLMDEKRRAMEPRHKAP